MLHLDSDRVGEVIVLMGGRAGPDSRKERPRRLAPGTTSASGARTCWPDGTEVGRHSAVGSEASVELPTAGIARKREIEAMGAGDHDLAVRKDGESIRDRRRAEIREDLAASAEARVEAAVRLVAVKREGSSMTRDD